MFFSHSLLRPVVSQPTAANFTFPSRPLLRRREAPRYQRIAPSSSLYNLPPSQARKEWASGEDPGIKLRRRRKRRQTRTKRTTVVPIRAKPKSAAEAVDWASILLEISNTHDEQQPEEPKPVDITQVPNDSATASTASSRAALNSTSHLHDTSVARHVISLETPPLPLNLPVPCAMTIEDTLEQEPSKHLDDVEIDPTPLSAVAAQPELSAVKSPELTQCRRSSRHRKRNNNPGL
jgi:hypothetical protein